MEYLALYLVTIIAGFVMKLTNEFRIFKDVADAGYKIDMKRVSELNKSLNLNPNSHLEMFIPIFNIMRVMEKTMQYNSVRPMILDQFNTLDCLQEMTESEKEEYQKNPTALSALLVNIKSEIDLTLKSSDTITLEFEDGEICYKFGESSDIIIVSASGLAANLTVKEQKQIVKKVLAKFVEAGIQKYGSEDAFEDALKKNKGNMKLRYNQGSKQEEQSDTEDLSPSERISALQYWKQDLLSGQEPKEESKTDDNVYTKKK